MHSAHFHFPEMTERSSRKKLNFFFWSADFTDSQSVEISVDSRHPSRARAHVWFRKSNPHVLIESSVTEHYPT
jgi:hypothetical protein